MFYAKEIKRRIFRPGRMTSVIIQIKTLLLICLMPLLTVDSATTKGEYMNKVNWQTLNRKNEVRIGLLIPDEKQVAAKHGAQLAIQKANKKGGYEGVPFELIVKSTSGPWGTSSKKSVSLVFEDEVLVMMGSLDSRNAHLAEQVVAKTKLVYLSAQATEMSLSNAYVPWYFRVVPNDKQQAAVLIEEIYFNQKLKNVAIIGTDQNDSELAVRTFIEEIKIKNAEPPSQFIFPTPEKSPFSILSEIETKNFEAIVLIGDNEFATQIIPILKIAHKDVPLFATLSITDNQQANNVNWKLLENVTLVSSGFWVTEKGIRFQNEFQNEFGYKPGPTAAYAYDGMNVIIEAVKIANPTLTDVIEDREKIINAFSEMKYKKGITGDIQFDENGNRTNDVKLMRIKNGKPVYKHITNEE